MSHHGGDTVHYSNSFETLSAARIAKGMSFVSASTPSQNASGPSKSVLPPGKRPLAAPPDPEEQQQLRDQFYNATIIDRIDLTEDLSKFRIRPDEPLPPFEPGQYLAIGLGNWEPRLSGTQTQELPVNKTRKIVRRAYSISCPMLHADGTLATQECVDYLEFYITLVRHGENAASKPPALTPRLFCKSVGDRLVMERKVTGKYVLGSYEPDDTMLFLGTGTGEAPHNAMVAKLLATGHRGRIVIATSVRYRRDCAYLKEHETLMQRYGNYVYLPLTTREEENIRTDHPHFVGKQYLQTLFTSGKLAELAGDPLAPSNTHVFLCGNPAMIGYVPPGADAPENPGMLPLLRAAGFHYDVQEHRAGTIRFEKYW
ncbi:Ferredoxin--NADP reductase [Allorhodopirellula heiligendammensis]|uniref:ferredoxin--NADP(+) reductase n=1 Tax=Allorhodopirellula heiligendammensis TaxID=2714739 RepID=A0A5C6BWP5_9BACT|nr:Ferredoxin--NADP reductase [Allorhodopirellula heiligendammensis]